MRTKILFFIVFLNVSVCFGADLTNVSVQATVLSNSNCRFRTATATINFGNIDQSVGGVITSSSIIQIRCGGAAPVATFVITDDDGLYETGPDQNRLRHSTDSTQYITYFFSASPTTGTIARNTNANITLSASIDSDDLSNAIAGTYTDTITLSITP